MESNKVVLNNSNATRPSPIAVIVIDPNKVGKKRLQDGRNDEAKRGLSYLGDSNNPGNVQPHNPVRHTLKELKFAQAQVKELYSLTDT
jgi:hypothetical protein